MGLEIAKIWKSVGLCQTFNTHEEAHSLCISYFVFCILYFVFYVMGKEANLVSITPEVAPSCGWVLPPSLEADLRYLFLPRNFKPQEIVHSKQKNNISFEIIYLVEPVPIFQFNGTFWYNHSSIFGLNICIFIQFSFSAALCASKKSFFLLPLPFHVAHIAISEEN